MTTPKRCPVCKQKLPKTLLERMVEQEAQRQQNEEFQKRIQETNEINPYKRDTTEHQQNQDIDCKLPKTPKEPTQDSLSDQEYVHEQMRKLSDGGVIMQIRQPELDIMTAVFKELLTRVMTSLTETLKEGRNRQRNATLRFLQERYRD